MNYLVFLRQTHYTMGLYELSLFVKLLYLKVYSVVDSTHCALAFTTNRPDVGDVYYVPTPGYSHLSTAFQISCVLKVPNTDLYIACADRWLPYDWVPEKAQKTFEEFEKGFSNYVPDLTPRFPEPFNGTECRRNDNTRESRYVWLPIEWDGDMPRLRWYDEWRIEDFI